MPVQLLALAGETGPLRLAFAPLAGAPCRGTIVLLTGRTEFVEKHEETLRDLAGLRCAAALVEWRGQGLSAREAVWPHRGYVRDFADYLDDLARALARLKELAAPRPWFMLAHSMGGHIGLRWLHDRPGVFAAAAMTAPMFGIRFALVPELVARGVGRIAVQAGRHRHYALGQRDLRLERWRFERNPLTSCPHRYARYVDLVRQRPELLLGGVTWGWLDAALRSIGVTRRPGYLEAIATPVLLCLAEQDRVVSNRSIENFAKRLPRATLQRFDAKHELLLERDAVRQAVLAAIDGFIARLGR